MTRYRPRAVLLLFLVLHLTACSTWQGIATTSPAAVIEATQPDRVRVTMPGGIQMELENPSVEGDELVGYAERYERVGGRLIQTSSVGYGSVPVADIIMLEVKKFSMGRTVLLVLGGFVALAGS